MIHWQTFYQQHKGMPLNEIMAKYNRILNEFNERQAQIVAYSTQNAAVGGHAGVAGDDGGGVASDPFLNNLTLSGSYFSVNNPSGVYTFTSSTWKEIHSHNAPGIKGLILYGNQLKNLDFVGLTGVSYLNLNTNPISSSLDITPFPSLVTMSVSGSAISSLNTNGLTKLQILTASYNKLTTVNLGSNRSSSFVDLSFNPSMSVYLHSSCSLTTFTLTGSTKNLTTVDISNNAVTQTSLDNVFVHISSSGHTGAGLTIKANGGTNSTTSSTSSPAIIYLRSGGATIIHN